MEICRPITPYQYTISWYRPLDIPERLTRLARSVENASPTVNLSRANHIHAAVFRFATRPRIGKFAKFKLTCWVTRWTQSEECSLPPHAPLLQNSEHENTKAQVEAFIRRCISSLYDCCELTENCVAWTYVLEYVRDSASATLSSVDVFVSQDRLLDHYAQIERGSIEAMDLSLATGDTFWTTRLSALFAEFPEIKD